MAESEDEFKAENDAHDVLPLQKAINSRRQSLETEIKSLNDVCDCTETGEEVSARRQMKMPLRVAIESRRHSLETEINALERQVLVVNEDADKSFKLPLEIESRRQSLQAEVVVLEDLAAGVNDEHNNVDVEEPLFNVLLSRRQSIESEIAELNAVSDHSDMPIAKNTDQLEECSLNTVGKKRSLSPSENPVFKKVCVAKVVEEVNEVATAILCDGCDGEFLLDEVGLDEIPSGDWFCKKCAAPKKATPAPKKKKSSKKAAVVEEVVDEVEEVATAILCDGCDGEFLLDEVGLDEIPAGDWFCKKCAAPKKSSKKSSKKQVSRKILAEVEDEEEEEDALAILCDECDGEFFLDELGLTVIPEGDWFCEACVAPTKKVRKSKKRSVVSKESDKQPTKKKSGRRT
jgi:hypothetical protein